MNGLEYGALVAQVGAGNEAQPSDESSAEIRQNVAVQVLHHQHVVLIRIHHQLHAGVVDDVLTIGNLGVFLGYRARAFQKQAIGQLHDVGFVNLVDLLAMVPARVLKSEFRDARAGLFGHDLQALDHAGDDLMFQSRVEPFGVFANDNQIDVGISCGNVRQVPDGSEVRIEFELLAQGDIDAREASTHGRCDWTFESDSSAL